MKRTCSSISKQSHWNVINHKKQATNFDDEWNGRLLHVPMLCGPHHNLKCQPAKQNRSTYIDAGVKRSIAKKSSFSSKRRVRFSPSKVVLEISCIPEERSEMWYSSKERKEFQKEVAMCLFSSTNAISHAEEGQERQSREASNRGASRRMEPWKHIFHRQQQREKLLDNVFREQHSQQQLLFQRRQQRQLPSSGLMSQLYLFRLKHASQLISYRDQLDAFQRGQADALIARQILGIAESTNGKRY